jgi:carbamoyltransferase
MAINILGISAYYHDSAACLLRDGEIVAAAQEERFSRKKHDARFPTHAVRFCLQQGAVQLNGLKYVVFYDKPLLKFERLLENYVAFSPKGIKSYLMAMPVWMKEKVLLKKVLQKELLSLYPEATKASLPSLLFTEHHEAHAASAFYPSPFEHAAVLCMDGVGEWATTSAWVGDEGLCLRSGRFPFLTPWDCFTRRSLTTPVSK